MEVVNEHERLYLASHKQCVNASLRDVGFSTVRCNLCNGEIKAGFFVVVMQCKHTFHKDCFHDHFSAVADNPQESDGISTGSQAFRHFMLHVGIVGACLVSQFGQVPAFESDLSNTDCMETSEDAAAVVAPETTMRLCSMCCEVDLSCP